MYLLYFKCTLNINFEDIKMKRTEAAKFIDFFNDQSPYRQLLSIIMNIDKYV